MTIHGGILNYLLAMICLVCRESRATLLLSIVRDQEGASCSSKLHYFVKKINELLPCQSLVAAPSRLHCCPVQAALLPIYSKWECQDGHRPTEKPPNCLLGCISLVSGLIQAACTSSMDFRHSVTSRTHHRTWTALYICYNFDNYYWCFYLI